MKNRTRIDYDSLSLQTHNKIFELFHFTIRYVLHLVAMPRYAKLIR